MLVLAMIWFSRSRQSALNSTFFEWSWFIQFIPEFNSILNILFSVHKIYSVSYSDQNNSYQSIGSHFCCIVPNHRFFLLNWLTQMHFVVFNHAFKSKPTKFHANSFKSFHFSSIINWALKKIWFLFSISQTSTLPCIETYSYIENMRLFLIPLPLP